jgi:hypothetical protein
MLVFLWALGAMGVAYWAKTHGRSGALWFALGITLTPVGASVILMLLDRRRT